METQKLLVHKEGNTSETIIECYNIH